MPPSSVSEIFLEIIIYSIHLIELCCIWMFASLMAISIAQSMKYYPIGGLGDFKSNVNIEINYNCIV